MSNSNNGIGIGCVLAIVLSYMRNASILYAILHGLCGWIYVLYCLFTM